MKLTSFCTVKDILNKMRRQPTEWEQVFANGVTEKSVIFSKICKQLIQLHNNNNNNNNNKNPIKNVQNT